MEASWKSVGSCLIGMADDNRRDARTLLAIESANERHMCAQGIECPGTGWDKA